MTPEERAALVEKVARNTYERCKARFAEDGTTAGIDDEFVEAVFPPWEEANQSDYLGDAESTIDLLTPIIRAEALREAAEAGFHAARKWVGEDTNGSLYDDDTAEAVKDAIEALIPSPQKPPS
ncbi:MAG: hypothetical protein ABFD96_06075 [Armatimonadia bacterium]